MHLYALGKVEFLYLNEGSRIHLGSRFDDES